ncbi:peptide chain release factor N(5)-glutamine methyltransferase [Psychroserpens jangbogonensis]|uniref:peptide chain release factor N(5)-glutamine methyltransferase n=1 Tax=Psychroserpens jangbogonensis TaxID=1484460 RepID=UPI00053E8E12|nr:peptide chain release factor N(5)-glutamine methyltransferase [Psychroserpens jangbogonensis]
MRLKTILDKFHSTLDDNYGKDEVNSFFDLIMEHHLGIKRIQLVLDPEYAITSGQEQLFSNALVELNNNSPIQYMLGETEFYGLPFKVNEYTLIPRPETEELVEWIITSYMQQSEESHLKILDIGTGSGCISISLAKNLPEVNVHALDVSEKALDIAKKNAKLNDVIVEFIHDDILNPRVSSSPSFDIIVSNPPYVRNLEKTEIKPNVLDNEPHLALFVDDENPLQFYKAICAFAQNNLKEDGILYFEINEYLGKEMILLLEEFSFKSIELKKDLFGKDRMIKGIK